MSMQQLTVKAHLKRGCQQKRLLEQSDEIRRFAVDYDVSTNYEYLLAKITSVFPGLVNKSITLYWKDCDGDMIAFSSDDELMEALKSISDGIFRVYIVEKKTHRSEMQPSVDQASLLHQGVTCDGCNGEVRGIRYKCTVCPDYDLCSQCKSTGLHGEHEMMAIERPQWPFCHFGMYFPGAPMSSAAPPMPPFAGPVPQAPPMPPFSGPMAPPPPPPAYGCAPPYPEPGTQGPAEAYCASRKAWKRWYKEACGYKHKKEKKEHKEKDERKEGKSSSSSSSESEGGNSPTGEYLRNVGHSVAAMLDPLGIDVEVDVEHHGRRKKCHRFGMTGSRMRGGPWCMRGGPWGMRGRGGGWGCHWGQSDNGTTSQGSAPSAANQQPNSSEPKADVNAAAAGPESHGQHATTNMETGEMASGTFTRSPDSEWTVVDKGSTDVDGATEKVRELEMSDKAPCEDMLGFDIPADPVIAEALQKMLLMGYNNEGGWLTNLLIQHRGDIGRVLDAIHRKKQ